MIKAIALDDEPPALDVIENFCNLSGDIDLVQTFTSDQEAIVYLNKYPVDLLFLDINMPSISGLEFKKQVRKNIMVIFTTAYSEFAVEGFNLNAVDYLLKPFTPERFLQAVEKAKTQYQILYQNVLVKPKYLNIRTGYSLVNVLLADIVFIEGLDDYLKIHLYDQKPILSRMTMKAILEKLPQNDFVRVHRSYIVPIARIDYVRNKVIFLKSNANEEIPLGTSYESRFYELFNK